MLRANDSEWNKPSMHDAPTTENPELGCAVKEYLQTSRRKDDGGQCRGQCVPGVPIVQMSDGVLGKVFFISL